MSTLFKEIPTRGELAGFSEGKGEVVFLREEGRFAPKKVEAISYSPEYLPQQDPSIEVLNLMVSFPRCVRFNLTTGIYEVICSPEKLKSLDDRLMAECKELWSRQREVNGVTRLQPSLHRIWLD